jgi:type I restriction enzyme S subunit
VKVALAEVCEINPPPRRRPGPLEEVSFLPMSALEVDGTMGRDERRPFAEVSKGYTLFERGDVLVAKITPCFENGKIAHAQHVTEVAAGSTEFHVIRPSPRKADARYILHFLRHPHVRAAGGRRMTGSGGQRRVPESFLQRLEVPMPPLEEQRSIAAVLDKADDIRAKRETSLTLLNSLNEAIFLDMFGNPVQNALGWPDCETLGEVADVVSGITKGRKLRDDGTRPVPYLAVANVQAGGLRLNNVKVIEATEQEIAKYRLLRGDIVLTEGGDPDKLGRGTVWNGEIDECLHQNHVFRVRIRERILEPHFLSALLASDRGRRYFLRAAKQTTGIASINKRQLSRFPILRPPIRLQHEFVTRLNEAEALRARSLDHAAELDDLFASLQLRAFASQL